MFSAIRVDPRHPRQNGLETTGSLNFPKADPADGPVSGCFAEIQSARIRKNRLAVAVLVLQELKDTAVGRERL